MNEVGEQVVALTGSIELSQPTLPYPLSPVQRLISDIHGAGGKLELARQGGTSPEEDAAIWRTFKGSVEQLAATLEDPLDSDTGWRTIAQAQDQPSAYRAWGLKVLQAWDAGAIDEDESVGLLMANDSTVECNGLENDASTQMIMGTLWHLRDGALYMDRPEYLERDRLRVRDFFNT